MAISVLPIPGNGAMATARRTLDASRQGRVGRIGATARRAAALALLLAVSPGLGTGLGHAARPGSAAAAEATGCRLGDFPAARRLAAHLPAPTPLNPLP